MDRWSLSWSSRKMVFFFDHRISNHHLPYIGRYVRITSAAMNAYRPPLVTEKAGDAEMANEMLAKVLITNNSVFERVEKGSLSSRGGNWVKMSANDAAPYFPKTSSEYLHKLTMGVYQLRQAAKYTDEHLNEKGDMKCMFTMMRLTFFVQKFSHGTWVLNGIIAGFSIAPILPIQTL